MSIETLLSRWKKRCVHLLVIAAPVFLGGCSDPQVVLEKVSPPPNVVIIIADDLGWNDVGAYGSEAAYTPHIDQLAREGVLFSRAFLASASCSSSRGSILTGRYPHSNGLVHLHQALPEEETTVAGYLKAQGYYTAGAGKWHIGSPAKRDFDLFREDRDGAASHYWIDILRERPRDKPFFMWLASRDPHRPHDGGKDFSSHYDVADLEIPGGFVDTPAVREEFRDYFFEVSRFDHDVGRVMDELRQQGVLENTLVIVMSDNGRPFSRGKTWIYDDGTKTPFIAYWPRGMGEPGVYENLFSAIDIAPTILDLAGVNVPPDMQGLSFAPVFHDRNLKVRDYVFSERNWHARNAHERAVRSENFLYKENQYPLYGDCVRAAYSGTASFKALRSAYEQGELDEVEASCFKDERDLVQLLAVTDQGVEFDNLADSAEHAATLEMMRQVMRDWRSQTDDFDYQPYQRPSKKSSGKNRE